MIKCIIPEKPLISNDILKEVCLNLFDTTDFEIIMDKRKNGRFVKFLQGDIVEYVVFDNPNNDSRNAHLMQFVSPALVQYYLDKSENKRLSIYLIDFEKNDKTDYVKMFYRCFATMGVSVLNKEKLDFPIVPFTSVTDMKNFRNATSQRNKHNKQTIFFENESVDNQILIYGKTFGANAMESFIFALTLKLITDFKIIFYPVSDNEKNSISKEQIQVLENEGIEYSDTIKVISKDGPATTEKKDFRNQAIFKYNLMLKYGTKKCYLCGLEIEKLIIASHIERVADINHSVEYSNKEKARRTVDGDNGLWLCANQDKMFEYGALYFNDRKLVINVRENRQLEFAKFSIFETRKHLQPDWKSDRTFTISDHHFTSKMQEYLKLHQKRLMVK